MRVCSRRSGERDVLVHHPFDAFEATVVRFLREARPIPKSRRSRSRCIASGIRRPSSTRCSPRRTPARRSSALVELKARFDEEHNVGWARALEARRRARRVRLRRAQGPREGGARRPPRGRRAAAVRARRHGQLQHALGATQYTDLSLFTRRSAIARRRRRPVQRAHRLVARHRARAHGALVAPHAAAAAVLELIERETRNARAGRPAAIAIKVQRAVRSRSRARALSRVAGRSARSSSSCAASARCGPAFPGMSDEHPRRLGRRPLPRALAHLSLREGGDAGVLHRLVRPAPRNLRRRVELLVPMDDAAQRAQLDGSSRSISTTARAGTLRSDGSYDAARRRRRGAGDADRETTTRDVNFCVTFASGIGSKRRIVDPLNPESNYAFASFSVPCSRRARVSHIRRRCSGQTGHCDVQ